MIQTIVLFLCFVAVASEPTRMDLDEVEFLRREVELTIAGETDSAAKLALNHLRKDWYKKTRNEETDKSFREVGIDTLYSVRAQEKHEPLKGIRGFTLRVTALPGNAQDRVKTSVELRFRQLGLPLEDLKVLDKQYKERRMQVSTGTKRFGRVLDAESASLLRRIAISQENELLLTILRLPLGDDKDPFGYACRLDIELLTDGTVVAYPDYWKLPASLWSEGGLYIFAAEGFERRLIERVDIIVDKFANDYLKANPRTPQPSKPTPKKQNAPPNP